MQSNLSGEVWKAFRGLAADKTVVIQPAGEDFSVVVWDRFDYVQEVSKQLQDKSIYKDVGLS